MPSSKHIGSYPMHLYAVVEDVISRRGEQAVEFDNVKKAQRIRMQVYGLRGALLADKDHPLHDGAAGLTTRLQGATLFITHVDYDVDSALLRAAGNL